MNENDVDQFVTLFGKKCSERGGHISCFCNTWFSVCTKRAVVQIQANFSQVGAVCLVTFHLQASHRKTGQTGCSLVSRVYVRSLDVWTSTCKPVAQDSLPGQSWRFLQKRKSGNSEKHLNQHLDSAPRLWQVFHLNPEAKRAVSVWCLQWIDSTVRLFPHTTFEHKYLIFRWVLEISDFVWFECILYSLCSKQNVQRWEFTQQTHFRWPVTPATSKMATTPEVTVA